MQACPSLELGRSPEHWIFTQMLLAEKDKHSMEYLKLHLSPHELLSNSSHAMISLSLSLSLKVLTNVITVHCRKRSVLVISSPVHVNSSLIGTYSVTVATTRYLPPLEGFHIEVLFFRGWLQTCPCTCCCGHILHNVVANWSLGQMIT